MLERFREIFKYKDLRGKIFFILIVFAVFRLMANIPIPGIDIRNLQQFFARFQMFKFASMFSGGSFDRLSIAMLGLGPYITAIIIFQLLTMVIPSLEKLYKEEGEEGRKKFNQYARIASIPLGMLQAYGMLMLFQKQGAIHISSFSVLLASVFTATAGSALLMWLGELITEKGIGEGVSLLIFAGIVARTPVNIQQFIIQWNPSQIFIYILFIIVSILIVTGVVIINEARRNIPVSYAKRVRGNKIYGGVSTYLPLNVNPAGVMPIIFALALMIFPSMIGSMFSGVGGVVGQISSSIAIFFSFSRNPISSSILYFILVFVFTYFYTSVTFDPKSVSSNLQKMGGFIPGVRPGHKTAEFLKYILNRVLFIGASFLGIIAILPSVIQGVTGIKNFTFLLGGTALLIIVAVVLDTWKQIDAQLKMRDYENF